MFKSQKFHNRQSQPDLTCLSWPNTCQYTCLWLLYRDQLLHSFGLHLHLFECILGVKELAVDFVRGNKTWWWRQWGRFRWGLVKNKVKIKVIIYCLQKANEIIKVVLMTPTLTDDKDLSRLIPGCLRFGGLHLLEELLEDPKQRLVVFGAKHLGDKGASFGKKLTGQLQSHESQVSCGWKREDFKIRFKYQILWKMDMN